jgi:hypothetical protein
VQPTVLEALGAAARAAARQGWLVAAGLAVALARAALVLPAQLFAIAIVQLGVAAWVGGRLPLPAAAAEGAVAVATSPRFLAIAAGLWASGVLLGGALRVAWIAGALPTLGRSLAGLPPAPVFAPGFARGFARLLPAALVGVLLEAAASAAAVAAVLGAALLARESTRLPLLAAALAAAALSGAALLALTATALADATAARAALRGEGPGRALARAAQRFARRPAAFLCVGLATALGGWMLAGASQTTILASAATGARAVPALVALGPQLMAWVAGLAIAAAIELVRLGASALLACGALPGDPGG